MSTTTAICAILLGLGGPLEGGEPIDDQLDRASLDTMFVLDMPPAASDDARTDDPVPARDPDGPPPPFGTVGSWRSNTAFGGGFHFNDASNAFARAGFGTSYFIAEHLSLEAEYNVFYFDQRDNDAFAFNVNLLFRCHVHREPTWSFFLDGGAGLMIATAEVPRKGSNFNFTPQAGAGFTWEVAENTRAVLGVRWLHVSNGSLYKDNPGRDYLMGYVGWSVPF